MMWNVQKSDLKKSPVCERVCVCVCVRARAKDWKNESFVIRKQIELSVGNSAS